MNMRSITAGLFVGLLASSTVLADADCDLTRFRAGFGNLVSASDSGSRSNVRASVHLLGEASNDGVVLREREEFARIDYTRYTRAVTIRSNNRFFYRSAWPMNPKLQFGADEEHPIAFYLDREDGGRYVGVSLSNFRGQGNLVMFVDEQQGTLCDKILQIQTGPAYVFLPAKWESSEGTPSFSVPEVADSSRNAGSVSYTYLGYRDGRHKLSEVKTAPDGTVEFSKVYNLPEEADIPNLSSTFDLPVYATITHQSDRAGMIRARVTPNPQRN